MIGIFDLFGIFGICPRATFGRGRKVHQIEPNTGRNQMIFHFLSVFVNTELIKMIYTEILII